MRCDRKNARVNQTEHSVLEHHLLLIHDSVEVKSVKSAKGSDVERQLDDLNTSIAVLDEKINQQLEVLHFERRYGEALYTPRKYLQHTVCECQ
jgi:hypothetical protein